jgi:hypothetical protein
VKETNELHGRIWFAKGGMDSVCPPGLSQREACSPPSPPKKEKDCLEMSSELAPQFLKLLNCPFRPEAGYQLGSPSPKIPKK